MTEEEEKNMRRKTLEDKLNSDIAAAWKDAVWDDDLCRTGVLLKQEMLENITVYHCADCVQVNFDIDLMPVKGESQIGKYIKTVKDKFPVIKNYKVSPDNISGISVHFTILFTI